MDCQSGCPLKSVSFAYFPAADPGSVCPAQGSALMWALMWLVWPRANHPRERRPKTWIASTAGSNSKTAKASRLRPLRLHAKDQTLPFRLPAPWRVVSSYPRLPFSSVARNPDIDWMRMRKKSGSIDISPTLMRRSPSALSHQ